MLLNNISRIENHQFYLDKAIRSSEKRAKISRSSLKGTKIQRSIFMEKQKIKILANTLTKDLENIEKAFPTIDNLPLFYQELINITIGKIKLKKSLAGMSWLKNKIIKLENIYLSKVSKDPNKSRKEFLGRISSMFKKIKKDFEFLEESRKEMRKFPSIKTQITTICIAGFPNVGKSTLLKKLTGASPEINVYPFTTKRIMLGYIGKKVQLIDTPGAFRQDINKMNNIEKQAFLALKYLCQKIIFVLDPTESCGYSIKDQEDMLKHIKNKFNKPILLYLSKTDLPHKKVKYPKAFQDINRLKKALPPHTPISCGN